MFVEDPNSLSKKEIVYIVKNGKESFPFFIENIYPYSFRFWEGHQDVPEKNKWLNPPPGAWVPAPHTVRWAHELQDYSLTAKMCARKHLKSTTLYAHVMWMIFKTVSYDFEGLYLSYKQDLSAYHTSNINKQIDRNFFFDDIYKLSPADSILNYSWYADGRVQSKIIPDGVFSFKRGRHPDIVWCDDILADPANALNLTVIYRITQTFFDDIMSLPKEGGQCHVWGTPQDEGDLFFEIPRRNITHDPETGEGFFWSREPAEVDPLRQKTVWENLFPWARLKAEERKLGTKSYSKEYLTTPVRSTESYFTRSEIESVVNLNLQNVKNINTSNSVFAGWDLGKKRHPSHISVFEIVNGRAIQIYQEFWDNVDYNVQFGRILKLKENLMIKKLEFDNSRGEFEMMEEQGELPGWMEGRKFTKSFKEAIATNMDKWISRKNVELINDPRQISQIIQVDNNLKAPETPQGHGDSFWSNALALHAAGSPEDEIPLIFCSWDD